MFTQRHKSKLSVLKSLGFLQAQKRAAVLGDSDEKKPLRSDEETPLALVNDREARDDTKQQVEDSAGTRSGGSEVDSEEVSNSEDVKTEDGCLDRSISADDEGNESEPLQSDHRNCVGTGEGREADEEAGSSRGDVNVSALQAQVSSTAECKEADARHEDTQDEKVDVIEILTLDKLSSIQLILRRGVALCVCVSFFITSILISVYIIPSLRPAISPNYANTTANYTAYDLLTENYQ